MKQSKTIFLIVLLVISPTLAGVTGRHERESASSAADRYWRTELYFGLGKNDGTEVSESEWQKFLVDEVTPRFPEGMTIIEASGQYRSSSGTIIREPSRVLIILYPKKKRVEADQKIDAICYAYKRIFKQESVLRVTESKPAIVTFK